MYSSSANQPKGK